MPKQSLWDQLSKGVADAVVDIREKVVEEPWYGRALTDHHHESATQWPQARETQPTDTRESAEQNHDREAADMDIDR
jgi:hypothetical protein